MPPSCIPPPNASLTTTDSRANCALRAQLALRVPALADVEIGHTRVVMICAQCSEENLDRAKFCSECGASLTATTSEERRERRIVTTLFADLAGFTQRSESTGCGGRGGVSGSLFRGVA